MFLEVPVFGNGFHIHESKCAVCYQSPIIGIYFSCTTCKNLNLCKNISIKVKNVIFNGQHHHIMAYYVDTSQNINYKQYYNLK